MYNVGDRLLCKKEDNHNLFTKGEYYEIINISNKIGEWDILVSTKEFNGTRFLSAGFQINPKNNRSISKYFISDTEIRKLKLERLQCIK